MKITTTNLEKKLKLKFIDQKILIKSLTHKSYDSKKNNEKIQNTSNSFNEKKSSVVREKLSRSRFLSFPASIKEFLIKLKRK